MTDYCKLEELKDWIWPSGATPDDVEDDMLNAIITVASRLIDKATGRRFYTTVADETRYYTAECGPVLFCKDDILSITTLATDADGDATYEDTWTATTDYHLCPENAALDGQPYTWIEVAEQGSYSFPTGIRKGVKIIGKFGYSSSTSASATIDIVKKACKMQTARLFERRHSPLGVNTNPVTGSPVSVQELDPDIRLMLLSVTRLY